MGKACKEVKHHCPQWNPRSSPKLKRACHSTTYVKAVLIFITDLFLEVKSEIRIPPDSFTVCARSSVQETTGTPVET
jgi:hypothetical protein